MDRIAVRSSRYEPLRHPGGLMLGMLPSLDPRTAEHGEHRGHQRPYALQHLLRVPSEWDAEVVRDDLRGYVIDAFGERDAVLLLDETGDLKPGT